MSKLSDEKIGAAVYASHVDITLSDAIALTRAIEAAVRAELAGQEPFDADDPRFREAFDASLKSGNWPMTRLGEGYRSSITMMAFTVAYETVNRLRLYAAPVVQQKPEPAMSRYLRYTEGSNEPDPIAFFGSLFLYLLILTVVCKIIEWRNKRWVKMPLVDNLASERRRGNERGTD